MSRLHWLRSDAPADAFPDVELALTEPVGLLAAGGDLSPARLIAAYTRGIFPWYEQGQPVLWWSPDPRAILVPSEFHLSRRLRRRLIRGEFEPAIDRDFAAVVDGCAASRRHQHGTWITPEMRAAYVRLHRLGVAHSVEVRQDGQLVGGIYGLAIGRVFFGESMFSAVPDASKAAMAWLTRWLQDWQYELLDCQVESAHLERLGSRLLSRRQFVRRLERLCPQAPAAQSWNPRPPRERW